MSSLKHLVTFGFTRLKVHVHVVVCLLRKDINMLDSLDASAIGMEYRLDVLMDTAPRPLLWGHTGRVGCVHGIGNHARNTRVNPVSLKCTCVRLRALHNTRDLMFHPKDEAIMVKCFA